MSPTGADSTSARPPLRRVWLDTLALTDFRNYRTVRLALGPPSVVLVGRNGAGKTNLLEAVSVLSPGRGLRRARYEEMARATAQGGATAGGWTVSARVSRETACGETAAHAVGTGIEPGAGGRRIRIDGADAAAEDLLAILRVLWLTPAMDGLFTGPESDRRRFLDRMTLAIAPDHGRHATLYEKAMRQRNRLLEEPRPEPAWLDAAETELARHGAALAEARAAMLAALAGRLAAEADGPGDFPSAALALAGDMESEAADAGLAIDGGPPDRDPHPAPTEGIAPATTAGFAEAPTGPFDPPAPPPAPDADPAASPDGGRPGPHGTVRAHLEALLRRVWRDGRRRDQAAGRTLLGPHRTRLVVTHVEKAMPAHQASTGEQKALLVSLVLAHARLTAETAGEAPVLLLDEIAAHLDPRRRAALFERLDALNAQCFMTGTDHHLFEAIADRALVVDVAEGTAAPRTG